MDTVKQILSKFEHAAHHPGQMVREWKQETGGKVVGCLPVHSSGAEELIHAAGMLPVGLWGGQTTISRASEYLQAFCCSIMKAVMEFSLTGVYKDLDAYVSPNTCDTMRCIPLLLKETNPEVPVIGLVLPDNRKINAGVNYLAEEFKAIGDNLSKISGQEITKDSLQNSIAVFSQHKALMNQFFKLANDHLDIITPYYRHMVIKSSFFVPREKHSQWLNELISALQVIPVHQWSGKKVVVTGIMMEPDSILNMLSDFNLAVVGDDLAQGSRQFRTPVADGDDPYVRLAQRFADFEGCATVHDPAKLRGTIIKDLVKENQADGVIVMMMKFCDPEEYDYPYIKTDLEESNIPLLHVEIEQQMDSVEQIRTRLQAFSEMLKDK
jgi:bcr-type benzoyl-CoA reductase subunit C